MSEITGGFSRTPTELITDQFALDQQECIELTYRGKTNFTTVTELFIDGIEDKRFQPPLGSTMYIRKTALGWNDTDDAAATNTPEVSTATAARTAADAVSCTEAATHVAVDIAADNTNKYLTVKVNPADATDVIYWKVVLEIFFALGEPLKPTGRYDGVQK